MFEAYGWASLGLDADADAVEGQLERARVDGWAQFHLHRGLNWAGTAVTFAVCRNHRFEPVFEIFDWLALHVPASYGLLHVRDQESDRPNEFRVWRLARGTVTEHQDPFLSPCVPTIEDEYVPPTDV